MLEVEEIKEVEELIMQRFHYHALEKWFNCNCCPRINKIERQLTVIGLFSERQLTIVETLASGS